MLLSVFRLLELCLKNKQMFFRLVWEWSMSFKSSLLVVLLVAGLMFLSTSAIFFLTKKILFAVLKSSVQWSPVKDQGVGNCCSFPVFLPSIFKQLLPVDTVRKDSLSAVMVLLCMSFQTNIDCTFMQIESKRGGVAGGPAGLQQNLAWAVRESLPEVPWPPGCQLQTKWHQGFALQELVEWNWECLWWGMYVSK